MDDKTEQARKANRVAAALVTLGIPHHEAMRLARAIEDKGRGKQLRTQSALAKKAATKHIRWPISWDSPGTK